MTDNEYYQAHHLNRGETFCPLMRCVCIGDGCAWYSAGHEDCAVVVIADAQSEMAVLRGDETHG